ncbi:MAG: DUF1194 domain-containing protein [Paracoccaceae bacterium]|nr:DUF1194 domain-containing protein [Paracoccaceae bacterium]
MTRQPRARGSIAAVALSGLLSAGPAAACELELVLAMDVSRSVVKSEYDLQMGGLAAAFRDPEIVETITWITGGVMVTVSQWSGAEAQTQPVPWTHLQSASDVAAFANAISAQKRAFFASYTAIGEALAHAASLSATNPMRCKRRVIDVSGDGASNRGRPAREVADALEAQGVTINGLVIMGGWPDPADFYRRNVVRGPASFLELADDFSDYADAIKRKLLRELAPRVARR